MSTVQKSEDERDLALLDTAIRTNTILVAVVFGLLGGAVMWFSTYVLIWRGGPSVGFHLSLLSIFLPGYEVSPAGAWIGFLWGALLGAVAGWLVYWSYARSLRTRLTRHVLHGHDPHRFSSSVLLLSGNALGFAVGGLLALQLFATTTWLVLRGTSHESMHALLLQNYLPGYDVTLSGGLIGAVELFVLAFIGCQILCSVYNIVARKRAKL